MGMVYRNIDAFVFQSNYTAKTINRVIIENRLEHTSLLSSIGHIKKLTPEG